MSNDSIGIDISKSKLDVHRLSDGAARSFANTKSGFAELRRWIGKTAPARVVYEATGPYHAAFERALADVHQKVVICTQIAPRTPLNTYLRGEGRCGDG